MRLLYVADGRSPIALNWMSYFVDNGHEVHLFSLYPCSPNLKLASVTVAPIPFSGLGELTKSETRNRFWISRSIRQMATPRVRTFLRHWFVPLAFPNLTKSLQSIISSTQPDLVHAMRIPYEGMITALAIKGYNIPLIISVWGNDFTLHAYSTHKINNYTRFALTQTHGLHTDCFRDYG
jgi:hypothetical protein